MQSGVVLVALGLGALFDTPAFGGLRPSISGAVWGVVAAGPVAAFVILLVHRRIPFALRLMQTVERSLRRPLLGGSVLQMAITAALAGLGEEALFRGVLQVAIGHVANPAVGLVAASLLFGAAHWVSRLYAGIATLFGLYLGWLFLVSDSLLVPIVAHAGYDFAILVYLRRGPATVTEG
jgi:hypothetical protein